MRVMIDTNILVSAILFPNSRMSTLIWDITMKHELVLCSYTIDELYMVFERKFEGKGLYLELFLSELTYELVYTPKKFDKTKYPEIRDPKDLPILVSAINSDIEVFITGDKDFHAVNIEVPKMMTASEFLGK